jgi:voltage-gated potassium channel
MNILARVSIDLAYALQASPRLKKVKHFFSDLLTNDNYPYKRLFDIFMMAIILSSVVILVREVKSPVNDFWLYFNNYIISIIFLVEYLLRLWVYSDDSKIIINQYEKDVFLQRKFRISRALYKVFREKFRYMRTLPAIIDLLAIVPFFHEFRLLRIFILFRVFKIFRYAHSLQNFSSVLSTKKFEFMTLLAFVAIIVFVSAVLIYTMEANNPASEINTLFDAFYWALVTISTVGFGDLVPVSNPGRIVAMLIIASGIGVIAFSTSIIVTAFTEKLDEIKENKTITDVLKLKHFYLICGYEEVAQQVASKLRRKGREVVVLDADEKRVKRAHEHGLLALQFDPASLQSYKRLGLDIEKQVYAVLCLREDDVQNVYTALTIRSMNKNVLLLSLLMKQENRKKLTLAGIDEVVYTQEIIGMTAKEFSGKPVAIEAIHELRTEQSGVFIEEIAIDERIAGALRYVKALGLEKFRLVLMGIYKKEDNRFLFNPEPDEAIAPGDLLLIIGEKSLIAEFNLSIHKRRRA